MSGNPKSQAPEKLQFSSSKNPGKEAASWSCGPGISVPRIPKSLVAPGAGASTWIFHTSDAGWGHPAYKQRIGAAVGRVPPPGTLSNSRAGCITIFKSLSFSRRFCGGRRSNIQHPTSNIETQRDLILHWELDVGCSLLDVFRQFGSGCAGLGNIRAKPNAFRKLNAKEPNNGVTSGSAIPKGLCLPGQGCEERALREAKYGDCCSAFPWVAADSNSNPNGVASRFHGLAATPVGLFCLATMSQCQKLKRSPTLPSTKVKGQSSKEAPRFKLKGFGKEMPSWGFGLGIFLEL